MEIAILLTFCIALFASLFAGVPLLYALLFGLLLFAGYAKRSQTWMAVLKMCWGGIKTARGILLLFVLLGLLTSMWRAAGTIPVIVSYALNLISPSSFLLITFLLNSAMSLLTGTALGTAATMGVVCAIVGGNFGIDEAWVGGAILAGVYFGNRISPISSMALLTANITKTNIYQNIYAMLKTTWLPFLLSCVIYFVQGFNTPVCFEVPLEYAIEYTVQDFAKDFSLSLWSLIPAGVIIVLSVARIRTSRVLLLSSLSAFIIAIIVENQPIMDLLKFIIFGYKTTVPEIAKMVNGGGLLSMW